MIWGESAKWKIRLQKHQNLARVLLRFQKICEISGDSGQQGGKFTWTPLGPPWKIDRPRIGQIYTIKHQIHLRMSYCIQQKMYKETHKQHLYTRGRFQRILTIFNEPH